MNRRQFVQTGSQVITGMLLVKAKTAFGYQANSAARHGLLGCGNRGTSVATSFSQNTSAQVVALADLFFRSTRRGEAALRQSECRPGPRAHRPEADVPGAARLRETGRVQGH